MATYNFTETDKTLASSSVNSTSNVVFLPINSSWGTTDEVVEVNSINGLTTNFGTAPSIKSISSISSKDWPEAITSYAYAQGVLNSGLTLALARMTSSSSAKAKWATDVSTFPVTDEDLAKNTTKPVMTQTTGTPVTLSSQLVSDVTFTKSEDDTPIYNFVGYVPNTFDVKPVKIASGVTGVEVVVKKDTTEKIIHLNIDEWGKLTYNGEDTSSEEWAAAYALISGASYSATYDYYQNCTYSFTGQVAQTSNVLEETNKVITVTDGSSTTNYQITGASISTAGKVETQAAAGSLDLAKAYALIGSSGSIADTTTVKLNKYTYTTGDDTLYIRMLANNAVTQWVRTQQNDTALIDYIKINKQDTLYSRVILKVKKPDTSNGIWAKYQGTYGNNISMYFSTQLKSKATGTITHVGKIDETSGKFVQVSVPKSYTYSLLMNVLINNSLKEQLEIATVDFVLTEPKIEEMTVGEITTAEYDFKINISNIDSDYVDILNIELDAETTTAKDAPAQKTATKYFEGGTDITDTEAQVVFADFLEKATDTKYEQLIDKWQTDIKFLSAGPFVESKTETGIIAIADQRGDCLAMIDHPREYTSSSDVETFASNLTKSSYAALYSPWCLGYPTGSTETTAWIPASYYALTSIGKSFSQGNSICDVPAGVNRGTVNIIKPAFEIGRTIMEKWQKGEATELNYCINPILKVRNYGYCIFGQRNLLELAYGTTSALQEVGVRITLNEIKKWVRDVCIGLTFESNSNRTWNEFVSRVGQCLSKLQQGGFLTEYKIYRDSTTLTEQTNTNSLNAVIQVYVTRALENFNINVEVYSGEVTITE